jgi:hypothetical protein
MTAYLSIAKANRGKLRDYALPWDGAGLFLTALKAKDLRRVAEATSLHAPLEASTRNQKIFLAILSEELSEEDLAELAKKLDGYQIVSNNQPKSSGIFKVTITKAEPTSLLRRTITMRHEKSGWKVQDISGEGELQKPLIIPGMRGRTGGRR